MERITIKRRKNSNSFLTVKDRNKEQAWKLRKEPIWTFNWEGPMMRNGRGINALAFIHVENTDRENFLKSKLASVVCNWKTSIGGLTWFSWLRVTGKHDDKQIYEVLCDGWVSKAVSSWLTWQLEVK